MGISRTLEKSYLLESYLSERTHHSGHLLGRARGRPLGPSLQYWDDMILLFRHRQKTKL